MRKAKLIECSSHWGSWSSCNRALQMFVCRRACFHRKRKTLVGILTQKQVYSCALARSASLSQQPLWSSVPRFPLAINSLFISHSLSSWSPLDICDVQSEAIALCKPSGLQQISALWAPGSATCCKHSGTAAARSSGLAFPAFGVGLLHRAAGWESKSWLGEQGTVCGWWELTGMSGRALLAGLGLIPAKDWSLALSAHWSHQCRALHPFPWPCFSC